MDSLPPLPVALEELRALVREQGTPRPELLDPRELAARTALPVDTVRVLLRGGRPPVDTVNDRVRTRVKALADAHLARTGQRMSDLAGSVSRHLGVSAVWARKVCSGQKVPSVELLHGLVGFFGVEGGEAFFTAPASEALSRALRPVLTVLRSGPEGTVRAVHPLEAALSGRGDVRGIALRQAHGLPQERWNVLSATLEALLRLDEKDRP
ncbi:hypothetical protein ACFW17_10985 [Streptomyces sp. NPDC058961]|uniref:hypothetical protein n=1 Tax=Streptomyces sp. NPDC058961 TaxID=3346680 RepID=UPI00367B0366